MKSSNDQLYRRGFLSDSEYKKITKSKVNISEYIVSNEAAYRTCAYRILKDCPNSQNLELVCEKLKTENELYSRIELCSCIVEYGVDAITNLDKLIGTIGNNQHKTIGNFDLNKKSFPLPRDIVARTMIRMGIGVLQYYKGRLYEYENKQLSEIIDVIGHISFTTGDQSLADELTTEYRKRSKSILIKWKMIKAFQSFDNMQIHNILIEELNNPDKIIANEAERSLRRIRERKTV